MLLLYYTIKYSCCIPAKLIFLCCPVYPIYCCRCVFFIFCFWYPFKLFNIVMQFHFVSFGFSCNKLEIKKICSVRRESWWGCKKILYPPSIYLKCFLIMISCITKNKIQKQWNSIACLLFTVLNVGWFVFTVTISKGSNKKENIFKKLFNKYSA